MHMGKTMEGGYSYRPGVCRAGRKPLEAESAPKHILPRSSQRDQPG